MKKRAFGISRGVVALLLTKALIIVLILNITSCTDDPLPLEELTIEEASLKRFGDFLEQTFVDNAVVFEANIIENSMTETESEKKMAPLLSESIVFLKELGFDPKDIEAEFGDLNVPVTAALALIIFEETLKNEATSYAPNFSNLFLTSAYANQSMASCAMKALGIASIGYIFEFGIAEAIEHYGKKGFIRVLGKAAGKALGWVGLAIAAYDFARCMQ
jgi:hypothetical protein